MSPDPTFTFQTLLTISFLAGVVVQIATLAKLTKNEPQKRDVTINNGYATREEMASIKNDHEKGARDQTEQRRLIYTKIDDLSKQVAGLQVETKMVNQQMIQMENKLDRFIERQSSSGKS